jgi:hypothetical protein
MNILALILGLLKIAPEIIQEILALVIHATNPAAVKTAQAHVAAGTQLAATNPPTLSTKA